MNITKELYDISWQVDEPTYRADPALSYSTLSTYEYLGFNGLDNLFDKKDTPSLTLGSVVDTIITGGTDEFNRLYAVIDINLTDGGMDTCKQLLSMHLPFNDFNEIPESIVSQAAKTAGFWQSDKWDKRRYSEVLKTGNVAEYYNAQRQSDKTIISTETYQDALNMVNALRESPATAKYFAGNDEMSPVRRYYQLKFKLSYNGVNYRNMADLIVVNYENKTIIPVDLKTSSSPEWDFEKSFVKWHYYIQARLYWRIIEANLLKDDYFKDFTLCPYRFIVVNKSTLTPLVWEFPLTQSVGKLITEDGKEIRDPFDIGEELQGYLNLRPKVPNGINMNGINTINCLKRAN